jgi:thiamine-phosphate pyrophosphorylase
LKVNCVDPAERHTSKNARIGSRQIGYSSSMPFAFPKLYPILDSSIIPPADRTEFLRRLGDSLAEAGVTLLEYRNKTGPDSELLDDAEILRAALPNGKVKLILDDRVDLVERIGFDGAHVDAGDLKPSEARRLLGLGRIVGTFGGSASLLPGILAEPVDYLSIGPVFPTRTKQTTTPPIGIDGVRRLRAQAGPDPVLVAIGGITLAMASQALSAGASVVAVAGAFFRQPDPAAEFRRWLEALS